MNPPDLEIEPDWEPIRLPFDIGSGRSMFVETGAGPTIRMRFFRRRTDRALVGSVWFGEATFGPPGFAHGGVVAFVLDEAMGAAGWLAGYPCVAAHLDVDFLAMTPLRRDCRIETHVDEIRPTKLAISVTLGLDGRALARGRGVFPRISRERLHELSQAQGRPLPDLSGYEFA